MGLLAGPRAQHQDIVGDEAIGECLLNARGRLFRFREVIGEEAADQFFPAVTGQANGLLIDVRDPELG